ncbi:MAG TPA: cytochrome c [Vicinamibacterales bacterium]|nr:cytochrome c [Vicinamibacterales bacterium]
MRTALAAALWLAITIPGSAQTPAIPKTIPEMWGAWCARCHGQDGTGKVSEPTVTVEPLDFSDCRIASAEPDADWEVAITHGGSAVGLSSQMPAFGDVLTADQVQGFVRHLRGFCSERNWPSGNFNLPRPIFTEKAFPENEFILLPVAAHEKNRPSAYTVRAIYERRIGRRAQIEAVLPMERVYVATLDDPEVGVGDVELGLKYALTPRSDRYLLSAGFDFVFPTGAEARLVGGFPAVYEPYLAIGTVVGGTYLQGQFKVEIPSTDSFRTRETIYNAYVGRDTSVFPNTWTVGLELNGENRELWLTPQIRKGLTRTGALGGAFGVRVPLTDRNEHSIAFVGYLLWEYLEPVFSRR